jgi:hypothetical protein
MRFQKMARISVMVLGWGAVLLMARPVGAQQDMDPTLFDDSSNTVAMDQKWNATASAEAANVAAADASAPLAMPEVDAAGRAPVDRSAVVLLTMGMGSIVLLAVAEAVRGSRRRTGRERTASSFPAGATAH